MIKLTARKHHLVCQKRDDCISGRKEMASVHKARKIGITSGSAYKVMHENVKPLEIWWATGPSPSPVRLGGRGEGIRAGRGSFL